MNVATNMLLIKRLIQKQCRAWNIEIRKAPCCAYEALPVFRLAVEWLSQRRGAPLKFIQVGANDGVFGDPIRAYVIDHGWTGILCEPQPSVFTKLKENYATAAERLVFENVAVGPGSDSITLYQAPGVALKEQAATPHALTVTSADRATVARQTGVSERDLVQLKVPMVTLDALVERHGFADFDVLQVDVEGYDVAVLETLSLRRTRPGVIQFEHGHLSRRDLGRVANLLESNGYMLYFGGHATDSVAMPRELLTT